ncbi:ATP-binding cassette domain-containing protein [Ectothiorhodospiraceae bacterium WFHF3C12]|nr:ATP-binding cassette domain-containing protein [Ectothiorhodospiraceae bacterium WFHF3C12]
MADGAVIEARKVTTRLGGQVIHDGLDLAVRDRELLAVAGSSGSGKTVLLRALTLLQPIAKGEIRLLGQPTAGLRRAEARGLRRRMGVMFQRGALFTGMSVLENVMFPLREHARLPNRLARDVAMLKIRLVGLGADAAMLRPNELSGGMTKRAALARALALDPDLLFLDEPTSGLDPVGSADFDDLIRRLQGLLNLTVVVVTHDVDSLWAIADRVAFLGDGRVLALGTMDELASSEEPTVRRYFGGQRMQRRQLDGQEQ